jgi:IstB-like ATP binding protein
LSHLFPTAVSFSASRKRLRSGPEEDGQAAKRKESDEDAPEIQTRCVAIHKAIKGMPDNLDLSNPSTFTTLPFPSLLPMPSQRFERKKINGIQRFEYMGRSKFRELQNHVENEDFLDAHESLYLYGTSGSGKSHLLAALVCHLVREGKRVFYIPDCSSLLLEPAETMRAAYHFAFYDSPVLGTIGDPYDVDALIRLVANDREVYIIVDQVNTLEVVEKDGRKDKKVQATNWLDALRFNHRYIFSASANENSNRDADRKQSGILVFRIFGGMSEVR